ncbi:hypothetical protein, partial [Virgibacillus senegalensis]
MDMQPIAAREGNHNLKDYEKTRQSFDWEEVKKEFSWYE